MVAVSVKNLGTISEGTVELKPLTIFVGPSNTGKSYMAMAIHAFMKASEAPHLGTFGRRINIAGYPGRVVFRRIFNQRILTDSLASRKLLADVRRWLRKLFEDNPEKENVGFAALPALIRSYLEEMTQQSLVNWGGDVVSQLNRIYGTETDFVRRGAGGKDFRLVIRRDEPSLEVEVRLEPGGSAIPNFDIRDAVLPLSALEEAIWLEGTEDEPSAINALWALQESASSAVFRDFPSQSFYLPAARSGITHGHKVLSAALVQQSSLVGIQQLNIPTLPGITTEFLGTLITLDRRMEQIRRNRKIADPISFIERDILHGSIYLDEAGGLPYPEIVYETLVEGQAAEKFTLEHTSSMVSEIAPLVLFLKYLVRPGDLLILEEPESHLHPTSQRQMARAVVRLVNAGVQVLITTHSDMFVSQINNLLRLSYATRRWRREHNFKPEDSLRHDQIAAYLFDQAKDQDGMAITRLEIDPAVGVDEDEFGKVINAIYEETLLMERIRVK